MADPMVQVKNSSSRDIFIDGDPNWDDQELKVDGRTLDEVFKLTPGSAATVSVSWTGPGDPNMMGVIFAECQDYDFTPDCGFFQLTIGQDPNLGVTDGGPNGVLHVQYKVENQTPWSMTMEFTDA